MSSPLSAIPGIEQIIQVFIADYSDYKASIITSVGATYCNPNPSLDIGSDPQN
ncbi:hypothetical protein EW026_g5384 [Hermanssonia centrifuga]|uniref:Uncharacterized protein n=1 Tax=Hermanssonia centrifuga TaxID=98765 RepID=A0A4S4KIL2_9APHY|nr:hypothetical protein EW026_g5384 [Hermanssonia centrifuga]